MAMEKIKPFEHVEDSSHFEFFDTIHWSLDIGGNFKFMLMELIAAAILLAIFIPIARRTRNGAVPIGKLWNAAEAILIFIRDEVAKPSIGEHDYKRFLPFLWTTFLFILVCNLLGMIPFMASATASLAVTGVLAGVAFVVIHWNGIAANHGPVGYFRTFIPHVELEGGFVMKALGATITLGITALELLGALIRAFVLAVRLFANMLAGHTVLFIMLLFIRMIGQRAAEGSGVADILFWPITFASIGMVTALSVLELFVACLQAFVFTFLTAVFIGLAMHPEH
jgi:F-type H+-transporting ATPase subunit a